MAVATKTLILVSQDLQKGNKENQHRSSWLNTLAVIAFTVSTWAALTVAGGTYMFYDRSENPTPALEQFNEGIGYLLRFYIFLAAVACVLLVPTILSLTAKSAVLGASGRENRLATLRLLGMSNGDITKMTMIETLRQAAIGIGIGTVLSLLTAPAWSLISFQHQDIRTWEMILPWWGYLAVWAVIVVLALIAAVIGLKRVLVSPLGVAKREMPAALKWRRVIIFAVVFVGGLVYLKAYEPEASDPGSLVRVVLILMVLVGAIAVVAPMLIQLSAKIGSAVPGRVNYVASRRVAANARSTWRQVGIMVFLGIMLGYLGLSDVDQTLPGGDNTLNEDIFTGIVITFLIAIVLLMVSTALTQAATIFETAPLTKALDYVGTAKSYHRKVAMLEMLAPTALVAIAGYVFGTLMAFVSMAGNNSPIFAERWWLSVAMLAAGVFGVAVVALIIDPLRQEIITKEVRRQT